MIRQASFSFLLSIVIHLIAMPLMVLFVITTSEELSDYVQVEWLRMSQPQKTKRRMLRKRIITELETSPVQRTSDTLSQKIPPVWTAASPETYHQGENLSLPPMPSAPITSSSFIHSSLVDFREVKTMPTLIKSQKALSPSSVEPKREGLPGLSSILEAMTPRTEIEPVRQDSLSPYLRKVRQKIEQVKKYPGTASKFGVEGTVYVEFTILSNGTVEKVEVARSSGHQTLDEAAVLAIKSAAPFQPFPETIKRQSLRIELPLVFKLIQTE